MSDERLQQAVADFEDKKTQLFDAMADAASKSALDMLSPEEVDLLQSFRRYKANIKRVATFKFLTRPKEE